MGRGVRAGVADRTGPVAAVGRVGHGLEILRIHHASLIFLPHPEQVKRRIGANVLVSLLNNGSSN